MKFYVLASATGLCLLLWLLYEASKKDFLLPAIIIAVVGAILALCLLPLIEGK